MYALSKYANGNIEEVLQKIDEGRHLTVGFGGHQIFDEFNSFAIFRTIRGERTVAIANSEHVLWRPAAKLSKPAKFGAGNTRMWLKSLSKIVI